MPSTKFVSSPSATPTPAPPTTSIGREGHCDDGVAGHEAQTRVGTPEADLNVIEEDGGAVTDELVLDHAREAVLPHSGDRKSRCQPPLLPDQRPDRSERQNEEVPELHRQPQHER